jgi:hypothetical protein
MRRKVYVVCGSTGEYSDHAEWLVAAYTNEKDAQRHVLLAAQEADCIKEERGNRYTSPREGSNRFDANMRMDYTGTSYYYDTTELHEKFIEEV